MSRYRDQVRDAVGAIDILGPMRYAWLGRRNRAQPAGSIDGLDARAQRDHLLAFLRQELYWSFYCRGAVVPARWAQPTPMAADIALARALAAANTGAGGWEPGWTVERIDGGDALVRSAGLRVRVSVSSCRADGCPVAPGTRVSLPRPAHLAERRPGFLTILGDAGDDDVSEVVRVYWHLIPRGAAALVGALTKTLNAHATPFRLKVANHPARFDRCDAAVLYLPARDLKALRPWLATVATELASWLRPATPAFTLPLAPGVGLAEDRADGESFGERRCSLVARGVLHADEHRVRSLPARIDAVAEEFARAGVDLDAPYLEPSLAGRHVL